MQLVVEEEQVAIEEQTIFDGVEVVSIAPIPSNLWKPDRQRYLRINSIKLADGRNLVGCGECEGPLEFVASWAEVTRHRRDIHGYRGSGGGAPKGLIVPLQGGLPHRDGYPDDPYAEGQPEEAPDEPAEPDDEPAQAPGTNVEAIAGQIVRGGPLSALGVTPQVDTLLADAAATEPAMSVPAALANMTFGEVLRLAAKIAKIGDLLEDMRIENVALKNDNRALRGEIDELAYERDDALRRLATASETIRTYHEGFKLMGLKFTEEGNTTA